MIDERYLKCAACGSLLSIVNTPEGPCDMCGGELVVQGVAIDAEGAAIYDTSPSGIARAIGHDITRNLRTPRRDVLAGDIAAELCLAAAELSNDPIPVSAILASHAVPYGKVFRQWFTDGKLRVWVNRGELEDLPRAEHGIEIFNDALLPVVPSWSGLPIHNV